jgi:hypothetical protein
MAGLAKQYQIKLVFCFAESAGLMLIGIVFFWFGWVLPDFNLSDTKKTTPPQYGMRRGENW